MTQVVTFYIDRYQVIAGRVFTVRRWADGAVARGEMTVAAFASAMHLQEEPEDGWYDGAGKPLGEDPSWPF